MGNFASRFHERALDIMLSGTHGYSFDQDVGGINVKMFDSQIEGAAERLAELVCMYADFIAFTWDVENDQLHTELAPGISEAQIWAKLHVYVVEAPLPSTIWDTRRALNNALAACHKTMYDSRWDRIIRERRLAFVSSFECMVELANTAARRMCEDFMVGVTNHPQSLVHQRVFDVMSAREADIEEKTATGEIDEPFEVRGVVVPRYRLLPEEVEGHLLVTMGKHAGGEIKTASIRSYGELVVQELYKAAPNFVTAERAMEGVLALNVSPDGQDIAVGVRPVKMGGAMPQPDLAKTKLKEVVTTAVDALYDQRAPVYVGMRHGAAQIAEAIMLAVQPYLPTESI